VPARPTELPAGLVHTRTTALFDSESVPSGLLRAHRLADGVWGRLVVHSGVLRFVFEDDSEPIEVPTGATVVIPPATPHHVELPQPVTFAVEFWKPQPGSVPAEEAHRESH
jgi:tellurite resistance-related uncharacterized protein